MTDLIKSSLDKKEYSLLTLRNSLQVLLISTEKLKTTPIEPETDSTESDCGSSDTDDRDSHFSMRLSHEGQSTKAHRAAACLTVGVGSFADAADVLGQAHYLEHMLFMGSAKYPKENEFEAFLSAHGGYSNGSTDNEVTSFFFEIGSGFFKEALDMFANFFISPLFQEDTMARELAAVESEFTQARQSDRTRLQQMICATSNPKHPYHRFTWGNHKSLRDIPMSKNIDVRKKVSDFYERYYSANIMKLVVCSDDSLVELENWVTESFSAIPNRNVVAPMFECAGSPFDGVSDHHTRICTILPVHSVHFLQIGWFISPTVGMYHQKPTEYIAHLLGHEGKGSILSYLKARGLITALHAGMDENDGYECGTYGAHFGINMRLTREGVKHWHIIVQTVFEYLHIVEKSGLPEWIFQELKTLSEISFEFQEELQEIDICEELGLLMQGLFQVDRKDLLRYRVLQGSFDRDLVQGILSQLSPTRACFYLGTQDTQVIDESDPNLLTEEWFSIKYKISSIDGEILSTWRHVTNNHDLELPVPNPFLPHSFSLMQDCTLEPAMNIKHSSVGRFWHCLDTTFESPRAYFACFFTLPAIQSSVDAYIQADIYVRCVRDALTECTYHATVAGCSYSLRRTVYGIELICGGFNDKQHVLVDKILEELFSAEITLARFQMNKEETLREYSNCIVKPGRKARYIQTLALHHQSFAPKDMIIAAKRCTHDDVIALAKTRLWTEKVCCAGLIHGNVSEEAASDLIKLVDEKISSKSQASASGCSVARITKLPISPDGITIQTENEHENDTNSAVVFVYQIGQEDLVLRAYAELLQQLMEEPLFDALRTKQGLGYEVSCCVRSLENVIYIELFVESSTYSSAYISSCIDLFITDFHTALQNLSDATFEAHLLALINKKLIPDHNLWERTDRFWHEIRFGRMQFDMNAKIAKKLEACNKTEMMERFQEWMIKSTRKLRVFVQSQVETTEYECAAPAQMISIDELSALQASLEFYEHQHKLYEA